MMLQCIITGIYLHVSNMTVCNFIFIAVDRRVNMCCCTVSDINSDILYRIIFIDENSVLKLFSFLPHCVCSTADLSQYDTAFTLTLTRVPIWASVCRFIVNTSVHVFQ